MLTTDIEDGPRGPSSKHSLGMIKARSPLSNSAVFADLSVFESKAVFSAFLACASDDEFNGCASSKSGTHGGSNAIPAAADDASCWLC